MTVVVFAVVDGVVPLHIVIIAVAFGEMGGGMGPKIPIQLSLDAKFLFITLLSIGMVKVLFRSLV